MDLELLRESLKALDDANLFNVLDIVSEEVKRRNNLLSPPISDLKNKSAEQNVKEFLSCLADLGVAIQGQK